MKNKDYYNYINKQEQIQAEKRWFFELPFVEEFLDEYPDDVMLNYYAEKPNSTKEDLEHLENAIQQLTEKQQKVIRLHLKGLTQAQIAEKLNITQGSVSQAIYGCYVYKSQFSGEKLDKPIRQGGIIKKLRKLINKNKLQ